MRVFEFMGPTRYTDGGYAGLYVQTIMAKDQNSALDCFFLLAERDGRELLDVHFCEIETGLPPIPDEPEWIDPLQGEAA